LQRILKPWYNHIVYRKFRQKSEVIHVEKVPDLEVYVQQMQKSFMDKMFFIDKIFEPIDTILDFGCANGVLIRAMQYLFPEYEYIGYDISEDMIRKAKELLPDCKFYKEWNEIAMDPKETLINISSTLHEVYSYGTEASVAEFWDRVFGSGFKYIAIRDMMVSESAIGKADPSDVEKARKIFPEKLAEYESIWGSIEDRFHLVHYLLKYSYTENWDREVNENYLPLTVEALLRKIPEKYEIVYSEHYVLPYVKQQIKRDSGIELKDATHFKILLKRKD